MAAAEATNPVKERNSNCSGEPDTKKTKKLPNSNANGKTSLIYKAIPGQITESVSLAPVARTPAGSASTGYRRHGQGIQEVKRVQAKSAAKAS